ARYINGERDENDRQDYPQKGGLGRPRTRSLRANLVGRQVFAARPLIGRSRSRRHVSSPLAREPSNFRYALGIENQVLGGSSNSRRKRRRRGGGGARTAIHEDVSERSARR